MSARRKKQRKRGDEIKKFQETILQTQNLGRTVNREGTGWGLGREAMKSRKRQWIYRERNRKRERRWRHGERNRKRERRSRDTKKEEHASLFLTERLSVSLTKIRVKVPSAHKQRLRWVLFFLWFFLGKLDLLYDFNFFNLVLDLDSKIRAKEIRF